MQDIEHVFQCKGSNYDPAAPMEFDSEEVANEPDDTPSEPMRLSDNIMKWQVLLREKVYTREPLT